MLYPTLLAAIADHAHPVWRSSGLGVYRFWRDLGYAVGAVLMITGGLVTVVLGVAAEGKSLEDIAVPLSVKDHRTEQVTEQVDRT